MAINGFRWHLQACSLRWHLGFDQTGLRTQFFLESHGQKQHERLRKGHIPNSPQLDLCLSWGCCLLYQRSHLQPSLLPNTMMPPPSQEVGCLGALLHLLNCNRSLGQHEQRYFAFPLQRSSSHSFSFSSSLFGNCTKVMVKWHQELLPYRPL